MEKSKKTFLQTAKLRKVRGLSINPAKRLIQLRDPMNFLRFCVKTFDNADQLEPVKDFPWDKPYIEPMVRMWQLRRFFCADKSRRMTISWLMVALHVHYCFQNLHRRIGFFSKKQEDADELIERAKFIFDHIPEDIYPSLWRPKYRRVANLMEFEEVESRILAFPQGVDQARQHGFSKLLFDEFGFWEEAEETYGATRPTLQGGGGWSIVSSHPKLFAGAEPFYKKLVQDRLDSAGSRIQSDPELEALLPEDREGVRAWTNKHNGFTIFELHYRADPAKRSPSWKEEEKRGYSEKDWATEYELSWETYGGEAVFRGAFHEKVHVTPEIIVPRPALKIIARGWDFGGSQSCLITQPEGQRLWCLNEFPNWSGNSRAFVPEVMSFCSQQYGPGYEYVDLIDPSGKDDGKTSFGISCMEVMEELGLSPLLGETNDPQKRIDAIVALLMTNHPSDGRPNLLISPDCHNLMDGLDGGYQFPQKATKRHSRTDRPAKNEWAALCECLAYIAMWLRGGGVDSFEVPEEDDGGFRGTSESLPMYSFIRR